MTALPKVNNIFRWLKAYILIPYKIMFSHVEIKNSEISRLKNDSSQKRHFYLVLFVRLLAR